MVTVRNCLLLFALVFAQGFLATTEVVAISRLKPGEAGFWAALNTGCYVLATMIVINEKKRWVLVPFYILASSISTVIGTMFGAHNL